MRRALLILILLASGIASAQPLVDTASVRARDTLHADPVRHRALWMESGSTAPKGRVFVGLHELLAVRAGYAPLDFIHIDLTYLLPDDQQGIGAKVQIVPPIAFFQGLALRAEVGRWKQASTMRPVQTYTGALSLGSEKVKLHLDYMAERRTGSEEIRWRRRARIGGSLVYPQDDPARIQSVNIEAWFDADPNVDDRLEAIGAALRTSKQRFVWEIGLVISPSISITGDGPGNRYPLPYLAVAWYI